MSWLKQLYAWLRGEQQKQLKKSKKKRRMKRVKKDQNGVQQCNPAGE